MYYIILVTQSYSLFRDEMLMANRLLTADQIKDYLNIPDFRHLTKNKLIEFVSAIPDMDKEVAIQTIEKFTDFSEYAKVLVAHYETVCESILKGNGICAQAAMEGYRQTLHILGKLAKSENLDPADKRFFAEKMVEVADKMAALDLNNKNFLAGMTSYIT